MSKERSQSANMRKKKIINNKFATFHFETNHIVLNSSNVTVTKKHKKKMVHGLLGDFLAITGEYWPIK